MPEPVIDPITQILTRMEVKMDAVLTQGVDHETRLRALEKFRWAIGGVSAIGGSAVTAAIVGAALAITHK